MQKTAKSRNILQKYGEWYLMLLIPVIGTIIFNLYPLVLTCIDSFHNTSGSFIGLTNYKILWTDPLWKEALINTVYMGILGVGFSIPLGFLMAYMMNRIPLLKNLFKTIYLFPMIVSIVAVSMVFKFIFNADPNSLVNFVLSKLGISPQGWFSSTSQARETVIVMTLWKNVGHTTILFFAGLQTLPTELLEAGDIDGANEWHKLWNIVIPNMKNTLVFVFITNTIGALKRFADVYAVASEYAYPGNKLMTIMLYIYRKSFSTLFYKDVGVAASASFMLFLFIIVITMIQMRVTGEAETLIGHTPQRRREKKHA